MSAKVDQIVRAFDRFELDLAKIVESTASREISLAKTKMDECRMWLVAHFANNNPEALED